MADDCVSIPKFVGALIAFVPITVGFAFAWAGVILLFVFGATFFSIAAFFMDPPRWAYNVFRSNVPENEESTFRLRKAIMILIMFFKIMAGIKDNDIRRALIGDDDVREALVT